MEPVPPFGLKVTVLETAWTVREMEEDTLSEAAAPEGP